MAVKRGGLGSKDPCDIQKNPKGHQNSFIRPLFKHFVWEIVKAPATSIALWPVCPCQSGVNCNFAKSITKLNLFILCFPAQ
jgi:hypothetical protein